MIVLGFDTATHATAVALLLRGGEMLEDRDDPPAGAHPGHATRLLAMAAELLARAGTRWTDLDRVAVGLGPGRFTGLRVGAATARGLAQSLDIELAGVSSLQALALQATRAGDGSPPVLAVIDALRGEVFAACFQRREALELPFPGALAADEVASELAQAAGEGVRDWLAVGDGAVRYRAQFEASGAGVPRDDSALHLVSARSVCELGTRVAPVQRLEELVPDYRRRPDAELRPRPQESLALAGPGEASP
ncbi:MAG TPA: tRNA (adenosine(37)-N6)-threonylcarbamoyltransferase complex dimerization subunit type 1 TsaB [Solirubrobacteraceae bacterium]|jgi:tRNA threonylcarbamoyladenosine biosynthesis protein TsaB|nr:tRNA (adenosine(37)-N6)-threonylcarbamoyltransferase complex dimerization subunit type 1 TsaB [Solirubrobacteraceae bacterium]